MITRIGILLLVAGTACATESVPPDFDRYPQTERFAFIVSEHKAGQFWFFALEQSRNQKQIDPAVITVPPH